MKEALGDPLPALRPSLAKKLTAGQRPDDRQPKTHCYRGHPLSGDNLYIAPKTGKRGCNKCRVICSKKYRNKDGKFILPEEKRVLLREAVNSGATSSLISHGYKRLNGERIKVSKVIVGRVALKRFLASGDDEAGLIRRKLEINRRQANHEGLVRLNGDRYKNHINILKSPADLAIPAVNAAVAGIPDFMRDEIRQELLVMLWSGDIKIDGIPLAIKKIRAKQYKDYDLASPYSKHQSLDAILYQDGMRTLHDVEHRSIWEAA
ncbi:MAG: hypothetical protein K5821_00290 [Nitrobacter sp.]|uniref:hypothetical protein n=1 Tax=Nitrobacter sp. TaxID=29420 RepID=UPI0026334D6B|nr:hypothetical protein [Nitrobacter sp.]MCV0384862.1 hypothetical protein [Nitrobacter sp.]